MKTPPTPLCVLAVLLLFAVTNVAPHGCGDIHTQLCLDTIRANLGKEATYWFGTSYATNCPGGSNTGTWECINKDTVHKSVITRLLNTTSNDTMTITTILNVTYFVPEEVEYEACGNMSRTEMLNLTLDPAHTAHAPSLSLSQMPSVTWAENLGMMHTLVIWNAGDLMLNGMFINIDGSNMSTAQTVMSYRGPVNPSTRTQPHLIAIFNQTAKLDTDFAVSQVKSYIENQGGSLNSLMSSLNLTGPVGVSLLTVVADPYSVEQARKMRIVNYCPVYVTTAFNALSLSYNVSKVNLTVFVDVTFRSPSLELETCCDDYIEIEAEVVKPNPIGNDYLQPVYTRLPPEVILEHTSLKNTYFLDKLYTFLLLDITGELNQSPSPSVKVHWQIINIVDGTLASGLETLPYLRPDPMRPNMDDRTYLFLLLRQTARLRPTDLTSFTGPNCTTKFTQRCRFNLTKFITTLNMTIEGASWFSELEDEDYRTLMANEGIMMTMNDLCGDICGGNTTDEASTATSEAATATNETITTNEATTTTTAATVKTCSHATTTRYSALVLAAVLALLSCLM